MPEGKGRPGRRPVDESDPSVSVSFVLPSKQYQHLKEIAEREKCSLGEVIRELLEHGSAKKII